MPSAVRVQGAAILQSSTVPSRRRPVGPPVRQGTLRAPWHAGPWRAPKPAPKAVSPPSDLKCNPVTTKMRLVNPTSATTIRPSSRPAPLNAEHPVTRCTSSRRPPTREIKLQTATSQASSGKASASRSSKPEQEKVTRGERPVTKGTNPIVKALPRRLRARAEDILPPSVTATRPTTTPLLSSNIHSTSFLSSTPLRPKISSPLLSAEIPLGTQTDGTHIIEGCEMRRALDKFDMESSTPYKSFLSCTPSRAGIGRIRRAPFRPCRDPCRQKAPLTSIRRESLLLSPRPVNQVKTPVPSDLVVHAERSISSSSVVIGESVPLKWELFIDFKQISLRKWRISCSPCKQSSWMAGPPRWRRWVFALPSLERRIPCHGPSSLPLPSQKFRISKHASYFGSKPNCCHLLHPEPEPISVSLSC